MKIYQAMLLLLSILSIRLSAQSSKTDLITAIEKCNHTFQSGTTEEIKANFPLTEPQEFIESIKKSNFKRNYGESRIIHISRDSALVLLTGSLHFGNSGDETDYSGMYSGIYVFKIVSGKWAMAGKLPIDRKNQLTSHAISASIEPQKGLISVIDTLVIQTKEPYGFMFALNQNAKIKAVQLNHKNIPYVFDGGILWLKSKAESKQKVTLAYSIDVDHIEKNKNSGYFDEAYGHLRNQFYWHPFFNFASENDQASFSLRISIPAVYHLATSLSQTDTIIGSERIISGKTSYPTCALGLYYDKDWKFHQFKKGQYKLEIYADNDFKPLPDSLNEAFSSAFDLLTQTFGRPQGNYLSIIQDRSNPMNGWLNRCNDMIVAAKQGSETIKNMPYPGAPFGHEVAHAWTQPTGPAANFLREGWASFAEGYFLDKKYGDSMFPKLLQNYRNFYFGNGFDNTCSLMEDISNGGVSYYKGVWIFYMLREQLGKIAFEKGLKAFMQSTQPMTIGLFIEKLSDAAGKDIHPIIDPWLKSRQVPHIKYIIKDTELSINQEGDIFQFPLELTLILNNGTTTSCTFNIQSKQQNFKLADPDSIGIKSVVLNPNHKILMRMVQ